MFKRTLSVLCCVAALFTASQAFSAEDYELKVGMQTWTLRNLNFEQAIEFCAKHKIKYLQLIPNHINPNAPKEELQKKKDAMEKLGLVPYTFGVAGTSMNKEENRKLFEFAKFMGMKMIVVEPGDFKILDNLEELAKEYDIKVCIHNHGIASLYGNPAVVKNLVKHRDARMGVCMDAGWIASTRMNTSQTFNQYDGRVFDIHLKDKKVSSSERGDVAKDTFIGEGDAKISELFQTLKKANYPGVVAIETDNDLKDPTEHVTKALEYIKAHKP
ncbi:MAG: sugar phosphate isomerase/epimerase family protein [Verrucomicrobiales bacterium]